MSELQRKIEALALLGEGGGKRTEQVLIRITKEDKDLLDSLSEKVGLAPASLAREMVISAIKDLSAHLGD